MARGPSAKNTREGRRTYPCGSIPLLPAIVLPRLAPLLMISPSNRKSDDTSIDHLFCLCTIGRRLSTSARGAGFACRCCRRVGYFGQLSRSEMSWRNRLTQAVFWCRLPQCWDNLLRHVHILPIDTAHAGRRYTPATAQPGTGADMGTPNTYGEWHEPVQVPSAAGAITEIDASLPGDRATFER